MAIPFLNNINLDDNQLLNAKLHVTSSAPTAAAGQIYFDSTAGVTSAKYYDGAAWISLIQHTYNNGTYINLTEAGTDATRTLTADLSATGTPDATKYLRGDNTWSPISTIPGTYTFNVTGDTGTPETISSGNTLDIAGGTYISTAVGAIDTITINHDTTSRTDTASSSSPGYNGTFQVIDSVTSNSTGHVTAVNVKTVTMPFSPEFFVNADTGTSQTIGFANVLTISGGTNINTTVGSVDTVTVNLDDSITLAGTLTVNGTGQSSFAGQVTIPTTPIASTDAASKAYVDASVAGGLVYQGGFDGSTGYVAGTTDYLDSRGTQIAVSKGWTYTVTVAGTFYGENVEVGDVLIAEDNLASGTGALSDWTTVQNNIDLASLTQVGIGNVNAATGNSLLGIDVAYSSGTASVGLDIDSLTDGSASVDPGNASLAVYNQPDTTNYKITINDIAPFISSANSASGQITAGSTSGTVTHNFATNKVIVQTYLDSATDNYPVVYCDITRTANSVTATIATAETNDIIILVQKIG